MPYSRCRCKRCKLPAETVGTISRRGLCEGCATSALVQSHIDMRAKSGRHYDAWAAGMLRTLGAQLADWQERTQTPV